MANTVFILAASGSFSALSSLRSPKISSQDALVLWLLQHKRSSGFLIFPWFFTTLSGFSFFSCLERWPNNRIPSHRELKVSGVWQVFRKGSGPHFLLPLPAWASAKAATTIPQTGWLNQQEFTLSQFWKLEVRDQGMISSLAYRRLSSCSRGILPLCPNLFFCVLIPSSCNWEQGYQLHWVEPYLMGRASKSCCQWARLLLGTKLCTHTIHILKS